MLISDKYRDLNRQLHHTRADYGKSSHKWAEVVFTKCAELDTTSVLDYGCGKGTLGLELPFAIQQYDPAITKYSTPPEPADIVICTDVLEHIEPDCLDDVLADLRRLTRKRGIFAIPDFPAIKTLADGRNAHLIVEELGFWTHKIANAGFTILESAVMDTSNPKYHYSVLEVE